MIFATANRHKLREMRELLPGVELEPLPDGIVLPPEDGADYAEIALEKARAAHRGTGRAAIADDSGIGAVALTDGPGSTPPATAGRARATARTSTSSSARSPRPAASRGAFYTCALALVEEDGSEHLFEGRCEGRLIEEPRGEGGFGYDPAFVPDATGSGDDGRCRS